MTVLMLGASNSRNSAGVFNSVSALGTNLFNLNIDIQFLMSEDEFSSEDKKHYGSLPLHSYKVKGPTNFGFSLDMFEKMVSINPDIVHVHGNWMYKSFINKKYHSISKTPYLISPHGMLDGWQLRQSRLKKELIFLFYEKNHLQNARCIHALCKEEYFAIRALGLKNPIAILPNGIDLPFIDNRINKIEQGLNKDKTDIRTLLFLGRLHRKKGLDVLLRGWQLIVSQYPNWKLNIAGNTNDPVYFQDLLNKTRQLKIENSVHFLGGKYGFDKEQCFKKSDAFILPSFSEGQPMAVLEAWSYGLPTLITSYCNLPEGFKNNAAIKIDTTVESIALGLSTLMSMSEKERNKMGQNGYKLVKERFTWDHIARSMSKLYGWINGEIEKPEFIFLD